jgi:HK97 family phage major capsid protein
MVEGSEGAGFANATAIVMHPKNWLKIRLAQQVGGPYLLGPINTTVTKQLDGTPVVTTTACPLNTALVGAFRPYATLLMREGLSVTMSTEHEDYFRRNLVALLAELRAALKITRPSAFCKVTGLS